MWKERSRRALANASTRLAALLTRELEAVFEAGRQLDVEIRDVVLEIGRLTPMVNLRVILKNRWWDDFWDWENERRRTV